MKLSPRNSDTQMKYAQNLTIFYLFPFINNKMCWQNGQGAGPT